MSRGGSVRAGGHPNRVLASIHDCFEIFVGGSVVDWEMPMERLEEREVEQKYKLCYPQHQCPGPLVLTPECQISPSPTPLSPSRSPPLVLGQLSATFRRSILCSARTHLCPSIATSLLQDLKDSQDRCVPC